VLDFPGAAETNLWRSNILGAIVGGYIDANDRWRAFVVRGGEFRTLRTPRGKTILMDNGDINSRGDVVGVYCEVEPPCNGAPGHGFLLTDDGRFTAINVPRAASTATFGMNELGDVVGFYTDAEGANHGFLMPRRVPLGIVGR
jgi:hypothetical protein